MKSDRLGVLMAEWVEACGYSMSDLKPGLSEPELDELEVALGQLLDDADLVEIPPDYRRFLSVISGYENAGPKNQLRFANGIEWLPVENLEFGLRSLLNWTNGPEDDLKWWGASLERSVPIAMTDLYSYWICGEPHRWHGYGAHPIIEVTVDGRIVYESLEDLLTDSIRYLQNPKRWTMSSSNRALPHSALRDGG